MTLRVGGLSPTSRSRHCLSFATDSGTTGVAATCGVAAGIGGALAPPDFFFRFAAGFGVRAGAVAVRVGRGVAERVGLAVAVTDLVRAGLGVLVGVAAAGVDAGSGASGCESPQPVRARAANTQSRVRRRI